MKIKDFVNVTKNRNNNQISFNLRARKLKNSKITPQDILNLNVPKSLKINKEKRRLKWK